MCVTEHSSVTVYDFHDTPCGTVMYAHILGILNLSARWLHSQHKSFHLAGWTVIVH